MKTKTLKTAEFGTEVTIEYNDVFIWAEVYLEYPPLGIAALGKDLIKLAELGFEGSEVYHDRGYYDAVENIRYHLKIRDKDKAVEFRKKFNL